MKELLIFSPTFVTQLKDHLKEKVKAAPYIAMSCDEVIANDNTSWISIHVYVMERWQRIHVLLKVHKMTGGSKADDLGALLTNVLDNRGGLEGKELHRRLISFGADEASVFQGISRGY